MTTLQDIAERAAARQKKQRGESSSPTGREKEDTSFRTRLTNSAFGSAIEGAAQAITFGMADEGKAALYAAFGPKSYSEELEGIRGVSEKQREEHGTANLAGKVAGSVLPSLLVPGAGASTLMGTVARTAAGGAAGGAAQAFGEAEGGLENRAAAAVDGALWGGAFGGTLGAAGRGVASVANKARGRAANKDLVTKVKRDKDAAYQAWRNTSDVVDPPALQKLSQDAKVSVRSDVGYNPKAEKNKEVEATLKHYKKMFDPKPIVATDGTITYRQPKPLHPMQLDELAQDAWDTYRRTNNPHMLNIINTVNDAIDALPESGVKSKVAKAANSRYRQVQMLEHVMDKVELQDAAGNTLNTGQRYRSALTSILTDPKKAKGFSPKQLEDMRAIVEGNVPEKIMEVIGKAAPTGNGLMQTMILIGSLHNPLVAAGATAATAARGLDNTKIKGQMQSLIEGAAGQQAAPMAYRPSAVVRGTERQAAVAMPSLMNTILPPEAAQAQENVDLPLLDMMLQKKLAQ